MYDLHCIACPVLSTEGPELVGEADGLHRKTPLNDVAKGCETEVQTACMAAAADEDAVGVIIAPARLQSVLA